MVGLWVEEFSKLFILENLIKDPDFVHGRLRALVSDASSCQQREEGEVQLEESTLREHHEAEASVAHKASSPSIIGSAQVA